MFTHSATVVLDGWDSLRRYRIGLIRGVKFSERNTADMDRYVAGDYAALFRMLENGRIDLAVSPRLNGIYHIKRERLANVTLVEPALEKFDLFHYIHRSRKDLALKPSEVLEYIGQHFSENYPAGR